MRFDFADVEEQLDWAKSHTAEVLKIADSASQFAAKYFSYSHMKSYWYR